MRYYLGLMIDWTVNSFYSIKRIFSIVVFYIKGIWYYYFYNKATEKTNGIKPLSNFKPDVGHLCESNEFRYEDFTLDLSIIIPAYNCADYLETCIDSVLSQSVEYSLEVIVIDDGSTDSTNEIIHKLASKENRIRIMEQQNFGQSVARNKAISLSRGKYIMFLDADDLMIGDSINHLMQIAYSTGSDIVEGRIIRFDDEEKIDDILSKKREKEKITIQSAQKNPYFVLTCYGYSVAKVYRRELWEGLRFPEGYIFEDIISKFVLRRKANQVAFTSNIVYAYRWNPNSSSHGKDDLKKLDSIYVLPKIIQLCEKTDIPIDNVFYLLSINHIALLNRVTSKNTSLDIQLACFAEMIKQVKAIELYRPKRIPFAFAIIEKSIKLGDFDHWKYFADVINENRLLKKYREIN